MEDQNNETVQQVAREVVAAAEETEVLPVLETEEVAVGVEENVGGDGDQGEVAESGGEEPVPEFRVTKKRGRPKKDVRDFMAMPEYSSPPPEKRGRGRPKGSGKWQTLAAATLGRTTALDEKARGGLKPHVLTIEAGEDLNDKLWAFSQNTLESVVVLSASGTLSTAHVHQPSVLRGGVLRYEGRYDIVNLKGSHTYTGNGGHRGKNCCLSVQLVDHQNHCFGGAVAGPLIAATPILLILATFKEVTNEQMPKMRHRVEPPRKRRKSKVSAMQQLQTPNGKLSGAAAAADAVPPTPAPATVSAELPVDDEQVMINGDGADAEEESSQPDDVFVSGDVISEVDAAAGVCDE